MNIRIVALLLAAAMLTVLFCGCSSAEARNLMQDIKPNEVPVTEPDGSEGSRICDFAVRLLQESQSENPLLSPVSVLYALGMTMNGADGNTRAQMESVLGFNAEDLNAYLHTCLASMGETEGMTLHLANGIWLKDDPNLVVEQSFLQTNADYYSAALKQTAFDSGTLKDINDFVKTNTDGMIPEILKELNPDAVMVLVNALCFEAKWATVYDSYSVHDRDFHNAGGSTKTVSMMSSTEYDYLEDENTTGFRKYYRGRDYAFAALLPEEGTDIGDYVASLTGEKLYALVTEPQNIKTYATMPKLELDYSVELGNVLCDLGMPEAFSAEMADFSRMAKCVSGDNIFIGRVVHKTHITLDEEGTKAAAATAVEMECTSAAMEPEETRTVVLDRPYVYLIWDCVNNMPLFIGVADTL